MVAGSRWGVEQHLVARVAFSVPPEKRSGRIANPSDDEPVSEKRTDGGGAAAICCIP